MTEYHYKGVTKIRDLCLRHHMMSTEYDRVFLSNNLKVFETFDKNLSIIFNLIKLNVNLFNVIFVSLLLLFH